MKTFAELTEEFEYQQLQEKLVVFGKGAKYGQIAFLSGGAGCFDGNTLVKTETGYKQIKDIESGEKVFTLNEQTKEIELKEVDKKIEYQCDSLLEDLLELTLDNGEKIICTENHLFYIDGKWVKAKDLSNIISKKTLPRDRKVYDLSIKDNHNYMITESDIIVHNSGKGFALTTFMEAEKYKVRDVDEWKKTFLKIAKLKNKYPEIRSLNLKVGKDVAELHKFVKKTGIKDKTLDLLLSDVKQDRLPNIAFDITGKDISDFAEVIPQLQEVGYLPRDMHLAWILTDFKVAYFSNLTRERVVPADIFLDTHRGAGSTMQTLLDRQKMPPGMDGRFVVIMNNRSNTIKFKAGETYKGKTIPEKAQGVKGFYYIEVKKEGKTFKPESKWKEELHKQIVDNIPGGQDTIDTLRRDAIEKFKEDLTGKSEKDAEKAREALDLIYRDVKQARIKRRLEKSRE